jgi:diaminopimelate decarboxylase
MTSQHTLYHRFVQIINRRNRRLPGHLLDRYVNGFIQRRDIFLESARRFGTPQYLFDGPSLTLQMTRFKEAFARSLKKYRIYYAMKSNGFIGLCRKVVSEDLGLDVSSGAELSRALNLNCDQIMFSGPGKTDDELRFAIRNRNRVTLLMDSFGELHRVSRILKKSRVTDKAPLMAGIRIQHQNHWNKFGIPLRGLLDMFKEARNTPGLDLCGIQFHTSWNLEPTPQIWMINKIGMHIRGKMPGGLWKSLQFLDIGGGFWPEHGEWLNPQNTLKGKLLEILIPDTQFKQNHYFLKARSIETFAHNIAVAIQKQGPPLCDLEVRLEPGRWISTPAMHILLKVIDIKDHQTVITDGGTNLLGWERPLTEYIPVINLSRPSLKERAIKVFGSLCTPQDIWGMSAFGDLMENDDILLIPDQGAYTYSLRQYFIKPIAKVVQYDRNGFKQAEKEHIL